MLLYNDAFVKILLFQRSCRGMKVGVDTGMIYNMEEERHSIIDCLCTLFWMRLFGKMAS